MFYEYSDIIDKQQKHPKVFYEEYLFDSREPRDYESNDVPSELDDELLSDSYYMKRSIRRIAQRIRNRHI